VVLPLQSAIGLATNHYYCYSKRQESRGSRSTDCEGAEAENEVSYQHFFNIVFQKFVYKNIQHNKIIFVQTT
jgi:hypothetical protein